MKKTIRLDSDRYCIGRRQFLRGAAFLGPAVAALFHGRSRPVSAASREPHGPAETHYRVTDHIRKYYEKAGS